MKLVFSSVFESDFSDGVEFLAREAAEKIAGEWENSVVRTLLMLQKKKRLGRVRRDLKPHGTRTFRVTGYPRYLVFYQIREHDLVLLRVKHGAMNLQALFSGG